MDAQIPAGEIERRLLDSGWKSELFGPILAEMSPGYTPLTPALPPAAAPPYVSAPAPAVNTTDTAGATASSSYKSFPSLSGPSPASSASTSPAVQTGPLQANAPASSASSPSSQTAQPGAPASASLSTSFSPSVAAPASTSSVQSPLPATSPAQPAAPGTPLPSTASKPSAQKQAPSSSAPGAKFSIAGLFAKFTTPASKPVAKPSPPSAKPVPAPASKPAPVGTATSTPSTSANTAPSAGVPAQTYTYAPASSTGASPPAIQPASPVPSSSINPTPQISTPSPSRPASPPPVNAPKTGNTSITTPSAPSPAAAPSAFAPAPTPSASSSALPEQTNGGTSAYPPAPQVVAKKSPFANIPKMYILAGVLLLAVILLGAYVLTHNAKPVHKPFVPPPDTAEPVEVSTPASASNSSMQNISTGVNNISNNDSRPPSPSEPSAPLPDTTGIAFKKALDAYSASPLVTNYIMSSNSQIASGAVHFNTTFSGTYFTYTNGPNYYRTDSQSAKTVQTRTYSLNGTNYLCTKPSAKIWSCAKTPAAGPLPLDSQIKLDMAQKANLSSLPIRTIIGLVTKCYSLLIPGVMDSEYCFSDEGALLYVHRFSTVRGNTTNLTLEASESPIMASDGDFLLPVVPASGPSNAGANSTLNTTNSTPFSSQPDFCIYNGDLKEIACTTPVKLLDRSVTYDLNFTAPLTLPCTGRNCSNTAYASEPLTYPVGLCGVVWFSWGNNYRMPAYIWRNRNQTIILNNSLDPATITEMVLSESCDR